MSDSSGDERDAGADEQMPANFLFGEADYLDPEERAQLSALGGNFLAGAGLGQGTSQKKKQKQRGEGSGGGGRGEAGPVQAGPDAVDFEDEDELIDDPEAPPPAPQPPQPEAARPAASSQLPLGTLAAPLSLLEEDDYDAEEEQEPAAPLVPPGVSQPAQPAQRTGAPEGSVAPAAAASSLGGGAGAHFKPVDAQQQQSSGPTTGPGQPSRKPAFVRFSDLFSAREGRAHNPFTLDKASLPALPPEAPEEPRAKAEEETPPDEDEETVLSSLDAASSWLAAPPPPPRAPRGPPALHKALTGKHSQQLQRQEGSGPLQGRASGAEGPDARGLALPRGSGAAPAKRAQQGGRAAAAAGHQAAVPAPEPLPDAAYEGVAQREWELAISWGEGGGSSENKASGSCEEASAAGGAGGSEDAAATVFGGGAAPGGPMEAESAPRREAAHSQQPRPSEWGSSAVLEPLCRPGAGEEDQREAHPQMLRLLPLPGDGEGAAAEQLPRRLSAAEGSGGAMEVDPPDDGKAREDPPPTNGELQADAAEGPQKGPKKQPHIAALWGGLEQNGELRNAAWWRDLELRILGGGGGGGGGKPPGGHPPPQPLMLDLNDPAMIFEGAKPQAFRRARALVVQALPPRPGGLEDPAAALAAMSVSLDAAYAPRERRGAAEQLAPSARHAAPALTLATLPPRPASGDVLAHRPRAPWAPPATAAPAPPAAVGQAVLRALVGPGLEPASRKFLSVSFATTTPAELWRAAKDAKFKEAVKLGAPVFWAATSPPLRLAPETPLGAALGPGTQAVEILLQFPHVALLPSARANALPDPASGVPIKPPGAFTRRKDLAADGGHIVLAEYVEEQPLLLSRPGMGLRLTTYYRKKGPADVAHRQLGGDWRSGAVEALEEDQDSPFVLGELAPGAPQLAADTLLFRAPAFAHAPAPSDFLLTRSATGVVSVRELTGTLTLGQQEPTVRVPAPTSKDARAVVERRLAAFVGRELRRQEAKALKAAAERAAALQHDLLMAAPAAPPQVKLPGVTMQQILEHFPPGSLSQSVVKAKLSAKYELAAQDGGAEAFRARGGVPLPLEAELRKLATPEQWCAAESREGALQRQRRAGVAAAERLGTLPDARRRLAAEMLPDTQAMRAAVAALEAAVAASPWVATDNFAWAMREGRGRLALRAAGPAVPPAAGHLFSFAQKEQRKGAAAGDAAMMERAVQGHITGTSNDLRRLSMVESREILLKLNVKDSEIAGLSRWDRIALVRALSSAAAADGGEAGAQFGSRYARQTRVTALEQLQLSARAAASIFRQQAAVLSNAAPGPLPKGASTEANLNHPSFSLQMKTPEKGSSGKKAGSAQEAEDAAELAALRKGGLLGQEGGRSTAQRSVPLEAEPGAKRLRRTITTTGPDGATSRRELLITDPDKLDEISRIHHGHQHVWGVNPHRTVRARTAREPKRPKGEPPGGGGAKAPPGAAAGKAEGDAGKAPKGPARCGRCGQEGHNRKSRLCPFYGEAVAAPAGRASQEPDPSGGGPSGGPSGEAASSGAGAGAGAGRRAKGRRKSFSSAVYLLEGEPLGDELEGDLGGDSPAPRDLSPEASPPLELLEEDSPDISEGGLGGRRGSRRGSFREPGSRKRRRSPSEDPIDDFIQDDTPEDNPSASPDLDLDLLDRGFTSSESPLPEEEEGLQRRKSRAAPKRRNSQRGPGGGGGGGGGGAGAGAGPRAGAGAPPKKAAKAEAKKALNRLLGAALAAAKKRLPAAIVLPFRHLVPKAAAPDYNKFVAPAQEMYLDKIEARVKGAKYTRVAEARADVVQIHACAAAYNAPGCGQFGGPAIIGYAEQLVQAFDAELALRQPQLGELERGRLPSAAAAPAGPLGIQAVQWVACSRCRKWRKVTAAVHAATVLDAGDSAWFCELNFDRPGASCAEPEDTEG